MPKLKLPPRIVEKKYFYIHSNYKNIPQDLVHKTILLNKGQIQGQIDFQTSYILVGEPEINKKCLNEAYYLVIKSLDENEFE